MPTFDGKSEKFELFEVLLQISLKTQNQLKEEDKINYFHSLFLSCPVMRYIRSKTSPAHTEKIWEKFWLCSVEKTWNISQGL